MAALSAREQINARRGALRVRTEINLKGVPLRLTKRNGLADLKAKADGAIKAERKAMWGGRHGPGEHIALHGTFQLSENMLGEIDRSPDKYGNPR
jgi:hypothetical protein